MRWWSIFSLASFGVLILVIIFITRKPLCIDSRLVEKIDRVSGSTRDEIYRCDLNKTVRFSTYWSQHSREVTSRLSAIELVLEKLNYLKAESPRVVILNDKKQLVYFHSSTLYLSEDLFSKPGWLERELIKFWLREKNEHIFSQNPLLAEALVENILMVSVGNYQLAKYDIKNKDSLSYLWLQNLRASSLECRYSRKFSDSISFCLTDGSKTQLQDMKIYFVRAWMESFRVLKLPEQLKFLRSVAELTPEGIQKTKFGGRFLIELASRLEKYGMNQTVDKPEFDLVYALDKKLENNGNLKKSVQEFSRNNENLRIALMDQEKVLFLPSGLSLSKKSLKSWKTRHLIYQSCSDMNFKQIGSFDLVADKLLLIRSCDQSESRSLQKYYKSGITGFASQNPFSTFIHFHLPSVALKSGELNSQKDVFEMLEQKTMDQSLVQSFGWQQLVWKKDLHAYAPRAYIDAIDLFRLPVKL